MILIIGGSKIQHQFQVSYINVEEIQHLYHHVNNIQEWDAIIHRILF